MFQGHDAWFTLKPITKDSKPGCQLQVVQELDYEVTPLYRMTITVTVRNDALICPINPSMLLSVLILHILAKVIVWGTDRLALNHVRVVFCRLQSNQVCWCIVVTNSFKD